MGPYAEAASQNSLPPKPSPVAPSQTLGKDRFAAEDRDAEGVGRGYPSWFGQANADLGGADGGGGCFPRATHPVRRGSAGQEAIVTSRRPVTTSVTCCLVGAPWA